MNKICKAPGAEKSNVLVQVQPTASVINTVHIPAMPIPVKVEFPPDITLSVEKGVEAPGAKITDYKWTLITIDSC